MNGLMYTTDTSSRFGVLQIFEETDLFNSSIDLDLSDDFKELELVSNFFL